VLLGICARQRAFVTQKGVGLRPPGSRKEFAVAAVNRGANRLLAHSAPPKLGDAPHHKAWQGRPGGRFRGSCRSVGPPGPLAGKFVEEVAELFSRSDAQRIYDAYEKQRRAGHFVAASMDRFPSRS
jgi:hypothetical protein